MKLFLAGEGLERNIELLHSRRRGIIGVHNSVRLACNLLAGTVTACVQSTNEVNILASPAPLKNNEGDIFSPVHTNSITYKHIICKQKYVRGKT